jgi:hypothetical protein
LKFQTSAFHFAFDGGFSISDQTTIGVTHHTYRETINTAKEIQGEFGKKETANIPRKREQAAKEKV